MKVQQACLEGSDESVEFCGEVEVEALEPGHKEEQAAGQQLAAPPGNAGKKSQLIAIGLLPH